MTDVQLIKEYLDGSEEAFEQLYARYRNQVFSYLNKMLPGQTAVVDDLYQQTWVKVVDNLHKYRDDNRFIAYILRIARNQAIDHLRRAGREIAVEPQHVEHRGGGADPSADLANREIAGAIKQAVEQLPAEQREVFVLRHQQMPFKEIARLQGVGINTVLGRMRYAMDNLRTRLEQAGVRP